MAVQSNKKLVDTLELLLSEVKDLKKIISSHSTDLSIIKENSNLIQLKVSDLSCKIDFDISTLNITTSKNKTVDKEKEKKLNIMTYFKIKYNEFPDSLESIVSKKEIDELFKLHSNDIKLKGKKKEDNIYKAGLIYRELFKSDNNRLKLLRAMKETEESNNTVVDPEIVENNIESDNEDD